MPKVLTYVGMVIAVLILLLFTLDLATPFLFRRSNIMMDIAFIICALGLGFLSWSTLRDLK